ncbi:hypothetical protein BLA29_008574, partial [Euroglyphus maynei]
MDYKKSCNKTINIDTILNYLGNIVFIAGLLSTSFVFTTAIPEYRCSIAVCDEQQNAVRTKNELFTKSFLPFTTPMKNSYEFDNCYSYGMNQPNNNGTTSSSCILQSFDNQTKRTCDSFIFNHEYFQSTIVTEYKLYCNNEWIVQLIQSLFFFGVLVGAIVNGILAD